ncbi:MAG: indole-3-glycerol phosphate synthase TrpC [Deltaproteobacteria bacterium]
MILDEIVGRKRKTIQEEFGSISSETMKQKLLRSKVSPALDVTRVLKKSDGLAVIAEIKPASPSKGIIMESVDPPLMGKEYFEGGADMISVLTEEHYFKGSINNLIKVRQRIPLPILRKDFIIDLRQIYQSRMAGADAILLIVSILSDDELKTFQIVSKILGMACIIEVHDEEELKRALETNAEIIGINNRNLKTFEVKLDTTERLIGMIPKSRIVVSESGIKTRSDMEYLKGLGVDAVLVGEVLMKADSPKEKLKELTHP